MKMVLMMKVEVRLFVTNPPTFAILKINSSHYIIFIFFSDNGVIILFGGTAVVS